MATKRNTKKSGIGRLVGKLHVSALILAVAAAQLVTVIDGTPRF